MEGWGSLVNTDTASGWRTPTIQPLRQPYSSRVFQVGGGGDSDGGGGAAGETVTNEWWASLCQESMQIAVVRWIKATRLINSLLGDQIHREVVSRALPVLEILIAAGAVSWE